MIIEWQKYQPVRKMYLTHFDELWPTSAFNFHLFRLLRDEPSHKIFAL